MIYIQRKGSGYLETVDEFTTRKEARSILAEYRLSDPYASYYLSQRSCGGVEVMRELIKQKKIGRFVVSFYVDGGECGSNWFNDLYTHSEYHLGGATIQVPQSLQSSGSYKFYTG